MHKSYDNVFDALEDDPAVARDLKLRSELMVDLKNIIQQEHLDETAAASRLEATREEIRYLLKGSIDNLSSRRLAEMKSSAKPMIVSPQELASRLSELFSAWNWEELEPQFPGDTPTNYHAILMDFAPHARTVMEAAEPTVIRRFARLVNQAIRQGGELENAMTTCFLEHASQLKVRTILRPHLSEVSKSELG